MSSFRYITAKIAAEEFVLSAYITKKRQLPGACIIYPLRICSQPSLHNIRVPPQKLSKQLINAKSILIY